MVADTPAEFSFSEGVSATHSKRMDRHVQRTWASGADGYLCSRWLKLLLSSLWYFVKEHELINFQSDNYAHDLFLGVPTSVGFGCRFSYLVQLIVWILTTCETTLIMLEATMLWVVLCSSLSAKMPFCGWSIVIYWLHRCVLDRDTMWLICSGKLWKASQPKTRRNS